MSRWVLAVIVALTTVASAQSVQDHHCKLADGSFDGTKTKKQCTAAKGTWQKDARYSGALKTGVNAIGGETTGITLDVDKQSYELDLHGDQAMIKTADGLNGKQVVVTGYLTTKHGVEIKDRQIVVVASIAAAAAPKK